MRLLRTAVALLLVLALAATASAGDKTKKAGKKKAAKPVQGVVIDFKKDEGKDTGTITVKVMQGKKKGGDSGEAVQKTFTVTDATKFEKVSGKKANAETKSAAFSDLAKDQKVVITAKGDTAEDVKIAAGKKKKKNK
jgi:hypothetical protein